MLLSPGLFAQTPGSKRRQTASAAVWSMFHETTAGVPGAPSAASISVAEAKEMSDTITQLDADATALRAENAALQAELREAAELQVEWTAALEAADAAVRAERGQHAAALSALRAQAARESGESEALRAQLAEAQRENSGLQAHVARLVADCEQRVAAAEAAAAAAEAARSGVLLELGARLALARAVALTCCRALVRADRCGRGRGRGGARGTANSAGVGAAAGGGGRGSRARGRAAHGRGIRQDGGGVRRAGCRRGAGRAAALRDGGSCGSHCAPAARRRRAAWGGGAG